MFSGLGFTPFFYLLFFGSLEGNFISVLLVMLSDFTDYIEYLLLVLLGSEMLAVYLFAHFSIAMFTYLGSTQFFNLVFFG